MDGATWAKLYLSAIDMRQAIKSGEVHISGGDVEKVTALFGLFDKFSPTKNFTIPEPLCDEPSWP
jgi:hypothetical protein